jgi:hypothetical protein
MQASEAFPRAYSIWSIKACDGYGEGGEAMLHVLGHVQRADLFWTSEMSGCVRLRRSADAMRSRATVCVEGISSGADTFF